MRLYTCLIDFVNLQKKKLYNNVEFCQMKHLETKNH